jgi:hypothetical protein
MIFGYKETLEFFVFLFGEYFAARFFLQSISKTFFILKKSKIEIDKSKQTKDKPSELKERNFIEEHK